MTAHDSRGRFTSGGGGGGSGGRKAKGKLPRQTGKRSTKTVGSVKVRNLGPKSNSRRAIMGTPKRGTTLVSSTARYARPGGGPKMKAVNTKYQPGGVKATGTGHAAGRAVRKTGSAHAHSTTRAGSRTIRRP